MRVNQRSSHLGNISLGIEERWRTREMLARGVSETNVNNRKELVSFWERRKLSSYGYNPLAWKSVRKPRARERGPREIFAGGSITFYECSTPETNRIRRGALVGAPYFIPCCFRRVLHPRIRQFLRFKMRIDVIRVPRRQWIQKHAIYLQVLIHPRAASDLELPQAPREGNMNLTQQP